MPLEIIRDDITKIKVDAIVYETDRFLSGECGLDHAIHRTAGPEFSAECRRSGGCRVGQAVITNAYRLPAKYAIHTVGPSWSDETGNAEEQLVAFYENALALAVEYQLESIAFPLLVADTKDRALDTAIRVLRDFLRDHDMMVFVVVRDNAASVLPKPQFSAITQYVNDRYIDEYLETEEWYEYQQWFEQAQEEPKLETQDLCILHSEVPRKGSKRSLEDVVNQVEETFSQMLLRLIDEKGMTDAETYKRANVDRRHFSKIRNDIDYRPKKATALAFAIALELNLDQTKDLLLRAGFALSRSSRFDIIIEYFIEEENYDIFEINKVLFAFQQDLLAV